MARICKTLSNVIHSVFSSFCLPLTFFIPLSVGSEKPGVVVVQLETNDGKVLGSTKFIYKEEISAGFKKIVCSKNYGGKLVKALSSMGTKKNPVLNNQTKTDPGKD